MFTLICNSNFISKWSHSGALCAKGKPGPYSFSLTLNTNSIDQKRLKNEVNVLADKFQGSSQELNQAAEPSFSSSLVFLCPQTRVLRAQALPPPPPKIIEHALSSHKVSLHSPGGGRNSHKRIIPNPRDKFIWHAIQAKGALQLFSLTF